MGITHTFVSEVEDGVDATLVRPSDWNAEHTITEGALVPSGVIVMWHGLIANIPDGWVICDGNNGTPNLLARFVEGVATAGTNPGTTGGAKAKTTTGHTHGINWIPAGASGGVMLVNTLKTATDSISDIRPPFYDIAFIMKT